MGSDPTGPPGRTRDDVGAVVVLVAASMGAILILVALVLDLSGARRDRDADQTAADAMALAAASSLGGAERSAAPACASAWDYIVVNLPTAETATAASCGAFDAQCDPAVARTATAAIGDYDVTFTHPVPDADLPEGSRGASADGEPCDRFGVRVQQDRAHLWREGSVRIDVTAVGRYIPGEGDIVAPLVLLSEHGCGVLTISGNGFLEVAAPGHVVIDSDGQDCSNPNKVVLDVDYDKEGVAAVAAEGISMWALNGPYASNAYKPGLLTPLPTASSAPVGREPMDRRYNCDPDGGCPGSGPPHIDDMVAAWGGAGTPSEWAEAPGAFTPWAPTRSCAPTGDTVVPAGNWYINCGAGGLSTGGTLTFLGGNIVSDGPLKTTGSGKLRVNCTPQAADPSACLTDPAAASILYLRSGDLLDSGALELRETMTYLATTSLNLGGSYPVVMTAPDDPAHPFDDLLVWSTTATDIKVTGGADLDLDGIIFVPNATVELAGSAGGAAVRAQIYASKAKLTGNGALVLQPEEGRTQLVGRGRVLLIR